MRASKVAHLLDVPLQGIEVKDQAGRLDVRLGHARHGGDVKAHFQPLEICMLVHGVTP
jgi:hypothetical protein